MYKWQCDLRLDDRADPGLVGGVPVASTISGEDELNNAFLLSLFFSAVADNDGSSEVGCGGSGDPA